MLTEKEMWLLSLLGALVVAALLIVINRLRKNSPTIDTPDKTESPRHLMDAKDGIKILVGSLIEGQIESSEACIRIKILIDAWRPELHEDEVIGIFNRVYERLSHMPTHAKRKAMDKRFRFKLDKQRFDVEREYEDEILKGAQSLRQLVSPSQ